MSAQKEEAVTMGSVVNLEVRLSPAERLKSVASLKARKAPKPQVEEDPDPIEEVDDEDDQEQGDEVGTPTRRTGQQYALPEKNTSFRLTLGNISFVLMVALPVLVTAFYLVFIAAPQFTSEFKFSVRQQEQMPLGAAGAGPVGGGRNAAAIAMMSDNFIIIDYLQSRDALEDIAKNADLQEMFATGRADWLNRLSNDASIEEKVAYWKGRVSTSFDMSTGIATVQVKAFAPEDAKKVADILLTNCERLINELQNRARHDAIQFFEDQVRVAEERLAAARAAVRSYRNEQQIVSPEASGEQVLAMIGKMDQERVGLQSQLSAMERFLDDSAPSVKVLRTKIKAVEDQIALLKGQVGSKAGRDTTRLSGIIASFEELDQNRIFAEKQYETAVTSLDMAQANAAMKHTYMAMFIKPKVAETAAYPKRLHDIFLVAIAAGFIWFVSLMTLYAIRDHAL